MKNEYEIYVPTVDKQGKNLDEGKISALKKSLVDRFGGMTDTRHKNEGFWKVGGTVVRDEIVIWRVISDEGEAGDKFLRETQKALEKALDQDKILIIKKSIDFL